MSLSFVCTCVFGVVDVVLCIAKGLEYLFVFCIGFFREAYLYVGGICEVSVVVCHAPEVFGCTGVLYGEVAVFELVDDEGELSFLFVEVAPVEAAVKVGIECFLYIGLVGGEGRVHVDDVVVSAVLEVNGRCDNCVVGIEHGLFIGCCRTFVSFCDVKVGFVECVDKCLQFLGIYTSGVGT